MLLHPTIEKLKSLRLMGMAQGFEEQLQTTDIDKFTFEERFGLLVDREETEKNERRTKSRLRRAKLRQDAVMEDIDYRQARTFDKSLLLSLGEGNWVSRHENCLITGPTGCGKTFIACALANKACRQGYRALYLRMPRLFNELCMARGDGGFERLLTSYSKTDVLILDDWGIAPLTAENRRDLLEILDDRYERRSTIITSQLPPKAWHEYIGDPTLADAILDRFVHNAHRLNVTSQKSMRSKSKLTRRKGKG